jgi:phosphoglycerate dehydrogenase-like enzyme
VFADLDREREILAPPGVEHTDPEPLPAAHPLRDHPRAIVTPHTGFHSVEATEELERRAAEEVARALRGEAPACPVNSLPATVS